MPEDWVDVFIALGSNLAEPQQQISGALAALGELPRSRLLRVSHLYDTAPIGGPPGQPDYLNAVALLQTGLGPLELLDRLQSIEQRHGRVRDQRWGARTLDLDILLFGDQVISSERLQVPHPRMHQRAFVLIPLADIAPPELDIPGWGRLGDLLKGLPESDVRRHVGE